MISGTVKHSSNVVEQSKLYMVRTSFAPCLVVNSLPHPYFAMFRRARFTINHRVNGNICQTEAHFERHSFNKRTTMSV